MSYAYDPLEDEKRKQQDEQSGMLGGGSGSVLGGQNSAPQSNQGQKGSGQFVNLQNYLNDPTNKGFGVEIADKIGSEVSSAESAQDQAKNNYQAAIDLGKTSNDQQNTQQVLQNPYLTKQQNPNAFDRFVAQRDAVYKGPQSGTDQSFFTQANDLTSKATSTASLTQNEGGRRALLQKYYGSQSSRPDYQQGQQNLDMLLAFGNPESKNALKSQYQRAQGLGQRYSEIQNELGQKRQQAINETQQARASARSALGIDDAGNYTDSGAIKNFIQGLNTQKENAINKKGQSYTKILNALTNKDITGLSQDDRKKLNLDDVYSLYNINLVNPQDKPAYLQSLPDGMIDTSSAATMSDLNNANALAELASLQQTWLDPSKIGTYDPNSAWSFDTNRFKQDLSDKRKQYETARYNLSMPDFVNPGRNNKIQNADIDDVIGALAQDLQSYYYSAGPKLDSFEKPYIYDQYQKAVNLLNSFNKQQGQTDVLKAGRPDEYGDLSDYTKNDIKVGWRTTYPAIDTTPGGVNAPSGTSWWDWREKNPYTYEWDKGPTWASRPYYETWDQYFDRMKKGDFSPVKGVTFK